MKPTEKRSRILFHGACASILAIMGAAFFLVEFWHLFLFWIGFIPASAFGLCNTYFWYLEYTHQRDAYKKHVTLLTTFIVIGIVITIPLFILLISQFPENINPVLGGVWVGIAATLMTGPFGVAIFYRQPTNEMPVYYRQNKISWSSPLEAPIVPFHRPVPPKVFAGIHLFPFHFVGYDLFFTSPNEHAEIRCRVCNSICLVIRGQYGPLTWRDYNREIYSHHNSFACIYTNQPWHNRALELVQRIEQVEIPLLRQDLIDDLRLLLKAAKGLQ